MQRKRLRSSDRFNEGSQEVTQSHERDQRARPSPDGTSTTLAIARFAQCDMEFAHFAQCDMEFARFAQCDMDFARFDRANGDTPRRRPGITIRGVTVAPDRSKTVFLLLP